MEQDQTLLNTLYTVYTRSQYKMLFPIVNCSLKKHKTKTKMKTLRPLQVEVQAGQWLLKHSDCVEPDLR